MIGLGTTLRCNLPPRHIWIVLNDPQTTNGQIVMVNLTTLRENCVDDVCILNPEDYSVLTNKTTVAYSRFQMGEASGLDAAISQGFFTEITTIPQATLWKILDGARRTEQLPKAAKDLLPAGRK